MRSAAASNSAARARDAPNMPDAANRNAAADTLVAAEDAVSTRAQREAQPLYVNRIKVYPRRVQGVFRRFKWAVLAVCLTIYYVTPWIRWPRGADAPDQAVLVDLAGGRLYFFWIEIWPQEIYFLTGLLILGAVGLFLVTSLFGRAWCGFACPQTVWTDLFMLVERGIEGDRNARMKLDRAPWSGRKLALKAGKHGAWLLIAAATGGAWIMYFNDAPTLLRDFAAFNATLAQWSFFALFAATTYLLAGWAREQVCTYMCPWPRFQAAMLDEQSIIVTYQGWRGEPRGKHKAGESWGGRGDCIDCYSCVAVCPTGIDIRDGQQLECIGCGLCIDACNAVMDKVGRPRELITFDTLANQKACAAGTQSHWRIVRPRTVIYATVLSLVGMVMLGAFLLRSPYELTVLRERAPLFVQLADGRIRNDYTVRILNKTRDPHTYALAFDGLADAQIAVIGPSVARASAGVLELSARADSVATYRVQVTAPRAVVRDGSVSVAFALRETGAHSGAPRRAESVFLGPR
jgi:cytochrome c oxidase accessory protein FixG